ncbi:hypothetical protein BDN70DRAFT_862910 [Pholiota conissans]|uniref:Peptidase M48 domain-containing protein n=1 Tax=Pholiota conissans TaxID=109636 RepID=A0A9P6CXW7_9AGAR|nr:hypothetical protein BDN70DRAFT_862910 [Pholiota conissans]
MILSTIHSSPLSALRLEGRVLFLRTRRHSNLLSAANRIHTPLPPIPYAFALNNRSSSLRSTPIPPIWRPSLSSSFHSTPPNAGGPLVVVLASFLKASTGFELARMASRIVLTFFPILLWKNMKSRKIIKYAAIHGIPAMEEHKIKHMNRIRSRTRILTLMMLVPVVLFWATIIASLENTPLTGRTRMILLSPEEEDEIAALLAGPGWYRAVGEILAEEGSTRVIPTSDWRYQWVQDTLRRLESTIPVLAQEPELCPNWAEHGPDCNPLPPPASHPLRPRPRASEYLRWLCDCMSKGTHPPLAPRPVAGAPYSLLLIDQPNASNAFSYGFGPDGGSGIVVYSGFLDDIFAKMPIQYVTPQPARTSLWNRLFGAVFPAHPEPVPTPEQTAELAILLAHEMAHLILAHHLESLSSVTVIVPGALSLLSDVIRVLIFPVTMMFGPFVNDAVAQLGKVGSGELLKLSEACSSTNQEIEADVVSARLLAHAGFDARDAIRFWEDRAGGGELDCAKHSQPDPPESTAGGLARKIMGETHPIHELRVNSLKKELERWETERRKALTASSTSKPG